MEVLLTYFPFVCLIFVGVNALIFHARAQRLAGGDQVAQEEYGSLIRGFVLYAGGWFLAQGIGVATGEVRALGIRSEPGAGATTYDWALLAGVAFVNLRFLLWVFREDGAALLARRGGIFKNAPSSPAGVRFWVLAMVAGSLFASSWRMWAATHSGG
jgi:hypothetical protein